MSDISGVEPLASHHQVEGFDCGSDAQTEWLHRYAFQAQQAGTSRVYVVRQLSDDHVVGYFALATGSVRPADAPARLLRGAGRYDQPVIILTRLGVDRGAQGRGLGRLLFAAALRTVAHVADQVGVRALLINCENERARGCYYRIAKFDESPTDPLHLTLLIKDLRRALAADS